MPRITLLDPCGQAYRIDTLDTGQLRDWFDEWLPRLWPDGDERMTPRIHVSPLFAGNYGTTDPDWLCDTRVIGDHYPFAAHDGAEAIEVLLELRRGLDAQLERIKQERGR
jgi:hypothetical protein